MDMCLHHTPNNTPSKYLIVYMYCTYTRDIYNRLYLFEVGITELGTHLGTPQHPKYDHRLTCSCYQSQAKSHSE